MARQIGPLLAAPRAAAERGAAERALLLRAPLELIVELVGAAAALTPPPFDNTA